MVGERESGRLREANQRRVLDSASRKRRARKALEALEQDNFHDDPHADLVMSKKVPKFQETLEGRKKRSKRTQEWFKMRFRKNFSQLLEESRTYRADPPNYQSALAPPSKFPERHFCAICGFTCSYTCVQCGTRYCSVKCLSTHRDTRCLKWTA